MFEELYIFVEGDSDERLFSNIICPELEEQYDNIKIWKYATKSPEDVNNFIDTINSMGADFIFVTDKDQYPCMPAAREARDNEFCRLDEDDTLVVIKEIESWYLAGLKDEDCQDLGIKSFRVTENIGKEKFKSLVPDNFSPRNFKLEILRRFCPEVAIRKNESFNYFMEKYECSI